MTRARTVIVPVLLMVLSGCQKSRQELATYQPVAEEAIGYDPSVVNFDTATVAAGTWAEPPAAEPAETFFAQEAVSGYAPSAAPAGARMHTVQARDTLYGLARHYYSDHRQWKKIYEANLDKISDPNRIRVGMTLAIP